MSCLVLSVLTLDDLPTMVALDQACLGGLWTLEGYQRELNSPNSVLLGLWKENPNKPTRNLLGIGCFWAILEEAHITILGVHPDYQGRGFGQLLLNGLLSKAVAWNLERATLEVRPSNQVAIAIYHKFGFQVAGRRRKYYQHPSEDALILWLSGLQTPEFSARLKDWDQRLHHRLACDRWTIVTL